MDNIQTLGVIGAGQMGAGICQVAASAGLEVLMLDVADEIVARGQQTIEHSLDRLLKKGQITAEEQTATLSQIKGTTTPHELHQADMIIEAVSERFDLKVQVLQRVENIAPSALLATNTSSISITKLAAKLSRPERFVGMHFMNPVPIMPLVELIAGLQTSPKTLKTTEALAKKLGKTTVRADDQPGFIVNRILMPMINEAFVALAEHLGTAKDIDAAMKLGTNQPMGPLELADFIGLDTCLAIMEVLHTGIGDPRYRPSPLLRRYVEAGWLGRKTGRGVYTHKA
ncbi:MAG: 3-hydroxybutyryl-CoA dehydrogenase [Myxococcales bacterium]|nr:3-hydroxybutyryl-CoA dehydrogenase [Myxococcales bacterium]